eukprot:5168456-Alexandrium_andersonii.AAC.1
MQGAGELELIPTPVSTVPKWLRAALSQAEPRHDSTVGGCSFRCPRACGNRIWTPARPQPTGPRSAAWPQFWCTSCKGMVRVSRAKCCRCEQVLRACRCAESELHSTEVRSTGQADIRSFAKAAKVLGPEGGLSEQVHSQSSERIRAMT